MDAGREICGETTGRFDRRRASVCGGMRQYTANKKYI